MRSNGRRALVAASPSTPGRRRAAHGVARAARWAPACSSARSLADVRAQRFTAPLNSSLAVGGARTAHSARIAPAIRLLAPASCAAASAAAAAPPPRAPCGGRPAALLGAAALGFEGYHALPDARKSEAQFAVFSALSPLMRLVDAETAHELGIELLARGVAPLEMRADDERLRVTLWADPRTGRRDGLRFPNPIGLAAGFDKDAKAFPALLGAGFGYVEIGSVTPKPQPGNPKPRVFRLPEHAAVINRYGFNSEGHAAAEAEAYRANRARRERIAANESDGGRRRDARGFARPPGREPGEEQAHPRSVGVRRLRRGRACAGPARGLHRGECILAQHARLALVTGKEVPRDAHAASARAGRVGDALRRREPPAPVLLKIAPDLSDGDVRDVASAARNAKVDGIIVSNTTVARPDFVKAHVAGGEAGGLSGSR